MSCNFWDPPIENRFLCPGHKVVPRAHCVPHFARQQVRGHGRGRGSTATTVPVEITPKWSVDEFIELIADCVSKERKSVNVNVTLRNGEKAACFCCGKVDCDKGITKCTHVASCGLWVQGVRMRRWQ